MPPEPRRPRRPPLDRQAIVTAAAQAIAKEGLESFSLRRLAGDLGVTAPALYAHVRSKEELVGAVAEAEFQRFLARLEAVQHEDPLERIRGGCRAYLDHARENPELFRLMIQHRPLMTDAPYGDELVVTHHSFRRAATAIQEAIDAGLFATRDPVIASRTIWTAIHGMVSLVLSGARLTRAQEEELFQSLMHAVLTGLRTPRED